MNNNMQGKTLVISGGTKGIGKECVYKFASNGVNVAFTYNSNGEVAQEICKDVIKEEYTEFETQETGEVTKNVKYSVIYMMMLKAMQEQQEIINDLKVRVEKLELGAN